MNLGARGHLDVIRGLVGADPVPGPAMHPQGGPPAEKKKLKGKRKHDVTSDKTSNAPSSKTKGGDDDDGDAYQSEDQSETEQDGPPSLAPYKVVKTLPYECEEHPAPLVQTPSMAGVEPPEITYRPRLVAEIREGLLSDIQVEAVCYANQAHTKRLPDGARQGFLLGDGAGVGKGRTIAAMILDQYRRESTRHVWVSVSSDLAVDAARDLGDLGDDGKEIEVIELKNFTNRKAIAGEGVLFTTYSLLIRPGRLQQIIDWVGDEAAPLLIFDEAHKAKGLVPEPSDDKKGKKSTKSGLAVQEIQLKLPNARVMYSSATAATEGQNLGFMTRMSMWGTSPEGRLLNELKDFTAFTNTVVKRGNAGLELISLDLKARGLMVARSLSYDSCEFHIDRVEPPAWFPGVYERCATFWTVLIKNHIWEGRPDEERGGTRPLGGLFWGAQQRFFKMLLMSAKVTWTVLEVQKALAEDTCCVISLIGTGEARTAAVAAAAGVDEGDDMMFSSPPKETLKTLIRKIYEGGPGAAMGLGDDEEEGWGSDEEEEAEEEEEEDEEEAYERRRRGRGPRGRTIPAPRAQQRNQGRAADRRAATCPPAEHPEKYQKVYWGGGAAAAAAAAAKPKPDPDFGGSDADSPSASDGSIEVLSDSDGSMSDSQERVQRSKGASTRGAAAAGGRRGGTTAVKAEEWEAKPKINAWGAAAAAAAAAPRAQRQQAGLGPRVKAEGVKPEDQEGPGAEVPLDARFPGVAPSLLGPTDPRALALKRETEEALRSRDPCRGLLRIIDEYLSDIPGSPLDDLIDALGGPDRVAEITGRKKRVVRINGELKYVARNAAGLNPRAAKANPRRRGGVFDSDSEPEDDFDGPEGTAVQLERINLKEKELFNDGRKRVSIISSAGSTGISLHADERFPSKNLRRVHFALELPWSSDQAVQQFGRSHRSNQVSGPVYRILFTKYGGEFRFASAVAKRLESLGAITQGDRAAGFSKVLDAFKVDKVEGSKALTRLLKVAKEAQAGIPTETVLPAVCKPGPDGRAQFPDLALFGQVLLQAVKEMGIDMSKKKLKVSTFLNRILSLQVERQGLVFDYFQALIEACVADAKKAGKWDRGVREIKGTIHATKRLESLYTCPITGRSCDLVSLQMEDRGMCWEDAERLRIEGLEREKAEVRAAMVAEDHARRFPFLRAIADDDIEVVLDQDDMGVGGVPVRDSDLFSGYFRSKGGRQVYLLVQVPRIQGKKPVADPEERRYDVYRPDNSNSFKIWGDAVDTREWVKVPRVSDAKEKWQEMYGKAGRSPDDSPDVPRRLLLAKNGKDLVKFSGARFPATLLVGGSVLPVWRSLDESCRDEYGKEKTKVNFAVRRAVYLPAGQAGAGAANRPLGAARGGAAAAAAAAAAAEAPAGLQFVGIQINEKWLRSLVDLIRILENKDKRYKEQRRELEGEELEDDEGVEQNRRRGKKEGSGRLRPAMAKAKGGALRQHAYGEDEPAQEAKPSIRPLAGWGNLGTKRNPVPTEVKPRVQIPQVPPPPLRTASIHGRPPAQAKVEEKEDVEVVVSYSEEEEECIVVD